MDRQEWAGKLSNAAKNLIARPHFSIPGAVILILLLEDAISSIAMGDPFFYQRWLNNWYVQEFWYIFSQPEIWWDATKFYAKLLAPYLAALAVPLIGFATAFYLIVYKNAFKEFYLNGYKEGRVFGWINPPGTPYKVYLRTARGIHNLLGADFQEPKNRPVDFFYSKGWKNTLAGFFNPWKLKRYEGSKNARIARKKSTKVFVTGNFSLVATDRSRRTYTDADSADVSYSVGDMDLRNDLNRFQSITGKAIGDALYSNPGVHKKAIDESGYIMPSPVKEMAKETILRHRRR